MVISADVQTSGGREKHAGPKNKERDLKEIKCASTDSEYDNKGGLKENF